MLLFHVVLLPLAIGVLVVLHVLLVRRRGVVPPFDEPRPDPLPGAEADTAPVSGTAEPAEKPAGEVMTS